MNNYLIPANSKRSLLYFSAFTSFDLILFACGVGLTFLLMFFIPMDTVFGAVIVVIPGLGSAFLVMPIPNYHNVLQVIKSMYAFYTTNERLKWKGWCFLEDGKQK